MISLVDAVTCIDVDKRLFVTQNVSRVTIEQGSCVFRQGRAYLYGVGQLGVVIPEQQALPGSLAM